jgi:copper chaperone CopZ
MLPTWAVLLGLLGGTVTADARVTSITIAAKGVLCLSCTYRLEKAIQRVEGVEKVRVQLSPSMAEVTPRAGIWLDAGRLRRAVKEAGFKPGELRYTVTGTLIEWQGQPAVRLPGSERVVLLQPEPGAAEVFDRARKVSSEPDRKPVKVEGEWVDDTQKKQPSAPEVLRIHLLQDEG